MIRLLRIPTLATAALMLAVPVSAGADGPVIDIQEWDVPWENTRPRDPYPAPDGQVWFVGQQGHYVAILDPEDGAFTRIELDPGTGPHTVIVDARGAWYAGNRAAHIGVVDPDTHGITRLELPGDGQRDPHTMAFTGGGDIWFSVQHGNQVGFLATDSGDMRLHDLPTPRSRPYGLVVDVDDRPWFTLFGTHALGTVDDDGTVREIPLPREEARPRRIDVTTDGKVWYVDFAQGYLGYYDPADGAIREWQTPGGVRAGPYAMGIDSHDRPWLVETGVSPNRFVGFDPITEAFTTPVDVPSGGGTVRHMMFDADAGGFWFGTDANTIGFARLRAEGG